MQLILSDQAKLDLSKIEQFTFDVWGLDQSRTYMLSFNKKFDSIATLPRHGRFLFIKNGWEFRKVLNKRHIIHYAITDSIIFIIEIKNQYQL
jgi:plasmid stabilization system protein ParE